MLRTTPAAAPDGRVRDNPAPQRYGFTLRPTKEARRTQKRANLKSPVQLALLVMLPLLAGACGREPETGFVSGQVTVDQKPVEHATVIFQPSEGVASYGTTDANGFYKLRQAGGSDGAVIGSHSVTIETYRIAVDELGDSIEHAESLPARYNSESELVREVQAGEQVIDFQLEAR